MGKGVKMSAWPAHLHSYLNHRYFIYLKGIEMYSRILFSIALALAAYICLSQSSAEAQLRRRLADPAVAPAERPVVTRARTMVGRIIQRRRARLLGEDEALDPAAQRDTNTAQNEQRRPRQNNPNAPGQAHPELAKPQLAGKPELASPALASQGQSPAERLLPTQAQLVVMDNQSLWNATRYISESFNDNLAKLTTAEGWQRHLVEPLQQLQLNTSSPTQAQLTQLKTLRSRFDKVYANPDFKKVNQMPSFLANQGALAELESRFSDIVTSPAVDKNVVQTQAQQEVVEESLPTPAPLPEKPKAKNGEHSILKRN